MAHDTPLSRRSLLAISAAAAAGTATKAAASLAPVNPDADLLRLEREHDALYTRIDKHNRRLVELDDDEFEAEHDTICDVEFAMQDIPAQTWAGVVAKARIAVEYAEQFRGTRTLDAMLPSLIDDIMRIANTTGKLYTGPASDQSAGEA
jgi:hypothetical protein